MSETYFVWLSGSKGPEAQIWHKKPTDGSNKFKKVPLFEHLMTAEEVELSLTELSLKYKQPKVKND